MLIIRSTGIDVIFESDSPYTFPYEEGKIVVPKNEIAYTLDERTEMVVFRSAVNGAILCSGIIGAITIDGITVTKDNLIDSFNTLAYAPKGGGTKEPELQEKSLTIDKNGNYSVVPDENYDALSSVDIIVAITSDVSALNFRQIGYSTELENQLNSTYNESIDYTKTLYDAWNPSNTSAGYLYKGDASLKYFPQIDMSNVTTCEGLCSGSTVEFVPVLNTSKCASFKSAFDSCAQLSKVVSLDTSNATTLERIFRGCASLTEVNFTDTSKVTNFYHAFYGCSKLESVPELDTSSGKDFSQMFDNCKGLISLDLTSWDVSNANDLGGLFTNCTNLKEINISGWNTSNVKTWVESIYGPFYNCTKLVKVIGSLSLKSAINWTYNYWGPSSLREITLTDIGANSGLTQCTFAAMTNWGVDSTDAPNARQSLVDSLITYSFDRAAAGYSNLTITLSTNSKNVLTDEEKAQIEAKGITLK